MASAKSADFNLQGEALMGNLLDAARELKNPFLEDFMSKGGRVIGYACVSTPREILDAFGILPYRIRSLGSPERDLSDAYMGRFNCGFCRSCLQLALDGSMDFLHGLIETNGCDHMRGMFENWSRAVDLPFFHYLRVPHVVTPESVDFFTEELSIFINALSEALEKGINDEELSNAISRGNRIREHMRRVTYLREKETPSITGLEAVNITLFMESVTPSDFEEIVEKLPESLEQRTVGKGRARLMLCGSATDELELISDIENAGGSVVADTLCYGTRAFWKSIPEDESPVRALARHYLDNLLCPRMYDRYEMRKLFTVETAERAGVDGVVLLHNKFCDIHGVDNVMLKNDLEGSGMPTLFLEKEYGAPADKGRIRTRIQAFLERIGK